MLITFGGVLVIFFCSSLETLVLFMSVTFIIIFNFLFNNITIAGCDSICAVKILSFVPNFVICYQLKAF